jgi:hypothetical protein
VAQECIRQIQSNIFTKLLEVYLMRKVITMSSTENVASVGRSWKGNGKNKALLPAAAWRANGLNVLTAL